MKGVQKLVLFMALLNLLGLMVVGGEGSGQSFSLQPDDMEDDLDDSEIEDGSGDWDTLEPVIDVENNEPNQPDDHDYELSFTNLGNIDDMESVEFYDYMEQYDDEDYAYMDTVASTDSVLKIKDATHHSNIEIRLKPEFEEAEEILLETSQIFIMVGSAFVSFAIFMLTFFLCRRMVAKRQNKKHIPFSVKPVQRLGPTKESSIVKDYEKVPNMTKQFLQHPHKAMYGETSKTGNPACTPLVQ